MGFVHKFGVADRGRVLLVFIVGFFALRGAGAQEIIPPSSSGEASVRLEAEQQRKEGDLYFADGKVEIQYKNLRLRADHVQYNTKTYMATANGHVLFDVDTQHLTAESADFNVQSGEGLFEHVRGEVTMEHSSNPNMLVSPNPLVFEAQQVRRLDARGVFFESREARGQRVHHGAVKRLEG
jgi:lipopolysaccharide assembly outer membrane protein LptD (OstA)